jgi:hypothetical protein
MTDRHHRSCGEGNCTSKMCQEQGTWNVEQVIANNIRPQLIIYLLHEAGTITGLRDAVVRRTGTN